MPSASPPSAMPHPRLRLGWLARWQHAQTAWLDAWPGLCPVCGLWAWGPRCPACTARFAPARWRCPRCAGPSQPEEDGAPCADPAEGTPAPAGMPGSTLDEGAMACCESAASSVSTEPARPPQARRAAVCPDCRHQAPPQVATVVAVDYRFPWSTLLPDLKFRERLDHAPWLAALLSDAVQAAPESPAGPVELVTAVPLAQARWRERGYNQAALLARPVAQRLLLPLDEALLLRWRSTGRQSALHRDARLENLAQAFIPHPLARARLAGRHVAVVDDVLTTGATLRAATLALLEGGARAVSLWVVARTPSPKELQALATDAADLRPQA